MKICEYCGLNIPNGQLHCLGCGAPAPAAPPKKAKEKHKPALAPAPAAPQEQSNVVKAYLQEQQQAKKRKAAGITLGFIGLVILLTLFASTPRGLSKSQTEEAYDPPRPVLEMERGVTGQELPVLPEGEAAGIPGNYFSTFEDGENFYTLATNGAFQFVPGDYPTMYQTVNGMLCYYLQAQSTGHKSDLYVMDTQGNPRKIMENVQYVSLAQDNDTAFFRAGQSGGDLYRYHYSTDTAELIGTDVDAFVFSPSGKHILFSNREYISYLEVGKMPQRLMAASDINPISISDDGKKYVFRVSNYGSGVSSQYLYFCHIDQAEPLLEYPFTGYSSVFYLNASHDDMLLQTEEGLLRYSWNGEMQTLSAAAAEDLTLLLPGFASTPGYGASYVHPTTFADFSNFYFSDKSDREKSVKLYRCQNGQVTLVQESEYIITNYMYTGDQQTLFYQMGSTLYKAQPAAETFASEMLHEDISKFSASPDGQTLFYQLWEYDSATSSGAQNLYVQKEGAEPQLVAKDVTSFSIGGPQGGNCTYIVGGKAYMGAVGTGYLYTADGTSTLVSEDVHLLMPPTASNSFVYTTNPQKSKDHSYRWNGDVAVYDGKSFVPVSQGVYYREPTWLQTWYQEFFTSNLL